MAKLSFSDSEVATLRFLADYLRNGCDWCGLSELPCASEIGEEQTRNRIEKFRVAGLVDWDSSDTFEIRPRLLEVMDQIDNPAPRDYWAEWTVWFCSRWWSLPVLVVFVAIPAIYEWVEMLTAFVAWVGGSAL
jgi:hypothetical protein